MLCDDGDEIDDDRIPSEGTLGKYEKFLVATLVKVELLTVAWWVTGLIDGVAANDEKSTFWFGI